MKRSWKSVLTHLRKSVAQRRDYTYRMVLKSKGLVRAKYEGMYKGYARIINLIDQIVEGK